MTIILKKTLLCSIPLAPLISGCIARIVQPFIAHIVTILGVSISLALSIITFYEVSQGHVFNFIIYEWMYFGNLKFEVGFLIDSLTGTMMCIVTFISLIVHIYSIGYMVNEVNYQRFFSYISLFTFSMLILVMSNNFFQLFFGWEAVGLISYLLIGFWFTRPKSIYANMKAFLVNRVGDFGFILGIGLLFSYTGSLNYKHIFDNREILANIAFPGSSWNLLTTACLCLFIGAMGKSAQFPLHTWLPDSMEGPTPISALIHAATMVTAGIFMVARMSPLFEQSNTVLSFILIIGSINSLFMGCVALTQNDIKRVIAYSTLSQLGYMIVALGVSDYSAAIFHLITHACFKALLFLAAGSVIIGMHHNQDIRYMGGLRKYMPITWITFLIASLSLIGFPFLSGFYSKDLIIESVKRSHIFGAEFAYFCIVFGVFITALYTFRMYFLIFHGPERFLNLFTNYNKKLIKNSPMLSLKGIERDGLHMPHESRFIITLPLILLAVPSMIMGAITVRSITNSQSNFFKNSIFVEENHRSLQDYGNKLQDWIYIVLHSIQDFPIWFMVTGILVAYLLYMKRLYIPCVLQKKCNILYQILVNEYYIDNINRNIFIKGAFVIGNNFWKKIDQNIIDNLVNTIVHICNKFSNFLSYLQTGYIHHYVFAMIIGVVTFLSLLANNV